MTFTLPTTTQAVNAIWAAILISPRKPAGQNVKPELRQKLAREPFAQELRKCEAWEFQSSFAGCLKRRGSSSPKARGVSAVDPRP